MPIYDISGNLVSSQADTVTVKSNNWVLTNEFLSVAESYLDKTELIYKDGDTIFYKNTATNGIDCSTYATLCLMGYPYEKTPYSTHQYKNPDSWEANYIDYDWAINPREYKVSRFADGSNPSEGIHLACQIARWMYERCQVVPLTNGFADVMPGDVVFWARKDSTTGDYVHPTWFKKINHVGFIYSKEMAPDTYIDSSGNTRTWDKTKYPYKHKIIDVRVETPPCQTLHWLEEAQEDPTDIYHNNVNTVVMICRPDFGSLSSRLHTISGSTEMGGISKTNGYLTNADVYWNTRSKKMYKYNNARKGPVSIEIDGLPSENDVVSIFFYDANGQFLSYDDYTGSAISFAMPEEATYFKLQAAHNSSVKRQEHFTIKSEDVIEEMFNSNIVNASVGGSLAFCYKVNSEADTSGRLILPPNYSIEGEKIPLIVFIHGSGGMMTWNSKLGELVESGVTISYLPYLQYLANEGFAVFDCYPWTNKELIPSGAYSPFNISIHRAAYLEGIKYVCSRFNVDIGKVSLLCKSQGGYIGQWAIMQNAFPFCAVALFAPSCGIGHTLFFNASCREALTKYVDFSGSQEEITAFVNSGDVDDTTVASFVEKNKAKLIAIAPMSQGVTNCSEEDIFRGVTTTTTTVPQWMLDDGVPEYQTGAQPLQTLAQRQELVKNSFTPSKIWSAFDDEQSSGYSHFAVYKWLANGASDTDFRPLPIGTGGHHAMDTDANALKSSGTTALGITYTDIPTAYVEVVDFIKNKCGY